ncbi:MAG: class I SAM-dependent methyltransferase [Dehalococcoidales bacterium]
MKCPVCKNETNKNLVSTYKGYSLFCCDICTVMFWLPLESISGDKYDSGGIAVALSDLGLYSVRWEHKRFLEISPNKGGSLLEVGCGNGEFIKQAISAGYDVTGIDTAVVTLKFSQNVLASDKLFPLTIQEFAARNPNAKFDVIVFFQVLEHIDNIPDFIDYVKRLLNPGGIVALSVPNCNRWRFKSERFLREEWDLPPCHLTRWNLLALLTVFNMYGFNASLFEVEPYKLFERSWSNFISQKIGINALAEKFVAKTVGRKLSAVSPDKKSLRKIALRTLGIFYLKVFFPILTVLTLPLKLVTRTNQGANVFLTVYLKNAEKKES